MAPTSGSPRPLPTEGGGAAGEADVTGRGWECVRGWDEEEEWGEESGAGSWLAMGAGRVSPAGERNGVKQSGLKSSS